MITKKKQIDNHIENSVEDLIQKQIHHLVQFYSYDQSWNYIYNSGLLRFIKIQIKDKIRDHLGAYILESVD